MDVRHLNQTCGSSCGPASLKMLMSTVDYKNELNIQQVFDMAPTRVGGTPWARMHSIIKRLNIKGKMLFNLKVDYFKGKNDNKKWMLSIYYADTIKHWVVLDRYDEKTKKFIINDPAGERKEWSEEELKYTFYKRGGLAIEFDLNDFTGKIETELPDIMKIVDKEEMRLNIDSNWVLPYSGNETNWEEFKNIIDNRNHYKDDYYYTLIKREFIGSDYKYQSYIFGYNADNFLMIIFPKNHEKIVTNSNLELK